MEEQRKKISPAQKQAKSPEGNDSDNDLSEKQEKGKALLKAVDQALQKALSKKDSLQFLLQSRQEGGE